MKYELWYDDGDNRYAVRHPLKYLWFGTEPLSLDEELMWWRDTEWDDSEESQFHDMHLSMVGNIHLIGLYDSFTEAYQQYRMEHLLNA